MKQFKFFAAILAIAAVFIGSAFTTKKHNNLTLFGFEDKVAVNGQPGVFDYTLVDPDETTFTGCSDDGICTIWIDESTYTVTDDSGNEFSYVRMPESAEDIESAGVLSYTTP